jgi:DNA primase
MGVALTGTFAGRVVVPVFDEKKTKIIGFTGRLINYTKWHKENKIGKWKHGGSINQGFVCGDEGIIKSSGIIIIVEGPGDVLALYEYGIKNAMCIFGTRISSKQLAFILKVNPKKILVSLNNEPDNKNIGLKAAEKLITTLKSYFNEDKIHLALPEYKDHLEALEKDKESLDRWREKWLNSPHGDCPTS